MFEALHSIVIPGWVSGLFAFVAVASTVITICIILSENRDPVKSLAWVTVLLLLPVVGLILYIFFGRNIKNTRMISQRNRRKLRKYEERINVDPKSTGLSSATLQQINLGRSLIGAQFYPDNTVEVYNRGVDKFEALKADLLAAKQTIHIQYFIFENDKIGNEIAQILKEKAESGVKVRLIYDHVGSFHVKNKFFKSLRSYGVEAHPFFKVTFPQFGTKVNWRNHRKICIIDNRVGYIGGMNIADRYIDGGKKFDMWRDTHVRVTGPVVAALQYSFAVDWNFMGGGLIEYGKPETDLSYLPKLKDAVTGVGMQLLTSGPTSQWSNIALAFHKAISNASKRVYIQSPYFLPTDSLLKALQAAALAHIDVRILIPHHSDSVMLTYASASYISQCLRAGIKIYLYKPGMLHSKMVIVDNEFVSIGSTNFDFRSFDYNFEANMFFFNRDFNAKMIEVFKEDLKKSVRVIPAQWRRRKLIHKIAESIIRLMSPVL